MIDLEYLSTKNKFEKDIKVIGQKKFLKLLR